jgi:UDP-galactopyranose mutase
MNKDKRKEAQGLLHHKYGAEVIFMTDEDIVKYYNNTYPSNHPLTVEELESNAKE